MNSPKESKISFLIFFVAFVSSIFWNELNITFIEKYPQQGHALYHRRTVESVDNEFYLSPVVNYENGYGWRYSRSDNHGGYKIPKGLGSYVRRTPGYSLFYFSLYKIFGFPFCLTALKIIQVFFFSLSAAMLFLLAARLCGNLYVAIFLSVLFSIFPLCNTYLYFTLTEGISPFLILTFIFYLFKAYYSEPGKKNIYYMVASFFGGYAILTRPYTGVAIMLLPVFIYLNWNQTRQNYTQLFKHWFVAGIIPVAMLLTWSIRNYYVSKKFVILELAIHPNNLDRAKPSFIAFWELSQCWGEDGSRMNSYHLPFWNAAKDGDTSKKYIDHILASWPEKYVNELGREKIVQLLRDYQGLIYSQREYIINNISMPDQYDPEDLRIASAFEQLRKEFKKLHPFVFYFKAPIIYLKEIIFHSNTSNVYLFYEKFYETKALFITKSMLKLLHVLAYMGIIFNLFFNKRLEQKLVFAIIPIIFLFLFSYIFRAIEQRYMLVYLPVLFLGLSFPITYSVENFRKRMGWLKLTN